MKVEVKMSKDFTDGYNEAIKDILAKRGMWKGADKKILKELWIKDNTITVVTYGEKSSI